MTNVYNMLNFTIGSLLVGIATFLALKSLFQHFASSSYTSTPSIGVPITMVVFGVGAFFIAHSLFTALGPRD